MVAFFTGLGAGFERSSVATLGASGLLGASNAGRGGEKINLNAATGNLLISHQDEFLVGRGPDAAIARTYNSHGALDENGDHWRQSTDRRIFALEGSVNKSGSRVRRVSADGSEIIYHWKGSHYQTTDGAGAHDKLTYANGLWTWRDGSSQITEFYHAYGSNNWRIVEQKDSDGNALKFEYSGNKLVRLRTADGGVIEYRWSANNITEIRTHYHAKSGVHDTGTNLNRYLTRTRYTYDGHNRLTKVTVDLSPENNSISDRKVYETLYTYHGSSRQIASVAQTDGSRVEFKYDGHGRVVELRQAVAGSQMRVTKLAYHSGGRTEITSPFGDKTNLYYNSNRQLTRIVNPPAKSGDKSTQVDFSYDSAGNMTRMIGANGARTEYRYDSNGNVTRVLDPTGGIVDRVYDSRNNLIRESTRPTHMYGAGTVYKRFVYDGENHLRYAISAEGHVTEYRYHGFGGVYYKFDYTENKYALSSNVPSLRDMDGWRNGLRDKSGVQVTRYNYDARGNQTQEVLFGYAHANGSPRTDQGYTHKYFNYDQAGKLLAKVTASEHWEHYSYDGLGRLVASTDLDGGRTSIVFDDKNAKTIVTSAAGFVATSYYNRAGELIYKDDGGRYATGGRDSYLYDRNGQLRRTIDATGKYNYFLYDNLGRKTTDITHTGDVTEYRYDKAGRLVATVRYTHRMHSSHFAKLHDANRDVEIGHIRPRGHSYDLWQWSVYDKAGRVIETISGNGSVARYDYDASGRLATTYSYLRKLSGSQLNAFKSNAPSSPVYPSTHSGDSVSRTFYDRDGRVVGVLGPEGSLTRSIYDGAGRKVHEIAYANKTPSHLRASATFDNLVRGIPKDTGKDISARYVYDGQGHLRYTIDGLNRVTEYIYHDRSPTWHAVGHVRGTVQYARSLANLGNYSFDAVKAAVSRMGATSSDRKTWSVVNNRGQQVYSIDASGQVARYFYNTSGQVTRVMQFAYTRNTTSLPTEGEMNSWSNLYSRNAHISYNYYSARGQLRFTIDAEGYVTRKDYDQEGRLYSEYRYDRKVSPNSGWTIDTVNRANKGGYSGTQYRYDGNGRLKDVYDSNGIRTTHVYYANGQKAETIVARGQGRDQSRTHYTYDAAGNLTRTIEGYGSRTPAYSYNWYDALGNVTQTQDANGNRTQFYYDKVGRVVAQRDALGSISRLEYDALGRTVKTTNARGHTSYTYYDKLGRATHQIDQEGYMTRTFYTAFGEVSAVRRQYNRAYNTGSPTRVPSVHNHHLDAVQTFSYDKLGRVVRAGDANGKSEEYRYDAFGQQTAVRNKLGGWTHYSYDKRGQLTEERVMFTPRDWVTNRFYYDARGNKIKSIEAYGRSEARTIEFGYDRGDRLVWKRSDNVVVYRDGSANYGGYTRPTEYYSYDLRGNLIETRDALGGRTQYWYDALNRVTDKISAGGTHTKNYYDKNGNVIETRVYARKLGAHNIRSGAPGNSGHYRGTKYTFDRMDRMTSVRQSRVLTGYYQGSYRFSAGSYEPTTRYEYDRMGNVVKTTDANGASTLTYYDKLGRKTYQVDAENYRTDWGYDAAGNVTFEKRFANRVRYNPSVSRLPSVGGSSHDRLTTYSYDRMGNRTAESRHNVEVDRGSTYYGGSRRITSTIRYYYNGLGQVTQKTEATGDWTRYNYDYGGRLTTEYRKSYRDHLSRTVTPRVDYSYNGLNDVTRTYQHGSYGVASRTTTYTYGRGGRLEYSTDAEGFRHYYRYDALGRVVRDQYARNYPGGSTWEGVYYKYDAENRVIQTGNVKYNYSRYSSHRRYEQREADHTYTKYNAFGDVEARGVNGRYSEFFKYDAAGRLIETTSGDGLKKFFMYDRTGNQTLTISSSGRNTKYYDINSAIRAFGGAHRLGYRYASGLAATITKYDKRGLATTVLEPSRQTSRHRTEHIFTNRSYNAFGEIAWQKDANNNTINYHYNTMGRVVRTDNPYVNITYENGRTYWRRPTEYNYYDASGRLTSSKDANGGFTRRYLLSGTGYNGSEALVYYLRAADRSTIHTYYDIHGDARIIRNQVGQKTYNYFDRMGRTTEVRHAGGLRDYYRYDGFSRQIEHWNNHLGSRHKDKTFYNHNGDVTLQVSMGGDTTRYNKRWISSLSTNGLGTFGGWEYTTTHANGRRSIQYKDTFGRLTTSVDLSGRRSNMHYDAAGRLARNDGGVDVQYRYFNTGKLYQTETFSGSSSNYTKRVAEFEYDKLGQVKRETLQETVRRHYYQRYGYRGWYGRWTSSTNTQTLRNAYASYDGLGRLTRWEEKGSSKVPKSYMTYKYDANGNVRQSYARFRTLDAHGNVSRYDKVKDYWFRYDNMNRVVTDKGRLSGGRIVRGTQGSDIEYDAAGRRKAVYTSFTDTYTDYTRSRYRSRWGYRYYNRAVTKSFTNTRREEYRYDAASNLTEVRTSKGRRDSRSGRVYGPSSRYTTLQSRFYYDRMGRQTQQLDYASNGRTVNYQNWKYYNAKGQVTQDHSRTRQGRDLMQSATYYNYGRNGNEALGSATEIRTKNWKNGRFQTESRTRNYYEWWGGAVQNRTTYQANIRDRKINTSYFRYANVGGANQLTSVSIYDGRSRTVSFTNDINGQVIRRDESDRNSRTGDPHEVWHRFAGREMGYLGNNGDVKTLSYAKSVQDRTTKDSGQRGAFKHGKTSGQSVGNFNQGIDPINSYSQGSAGGQYTVRSGDTFASIAAQIYGDASLWYKIAGANGMTGQTALAEGQSLRLPSSVQRNTYNASTIKPYDPAASIGDTSPTEAPEPPKGKGGKCGVIGQIIMVVIAVVVTVYTAGAASGALIAAFGQTGGAIAAGAVAGAAGSVASQGFGVAVGIQDKFSWNAVAMAGISGAVGGAFGGVGKVTDVKSFAGAALKGAATNAVGQGINMAVGLQSRFNWAGMAAAGAGAAVGSAVGTKLGATSLRSNFSAKNIGTNAAKISASAVADAATRSAIDGSSFRDNFRAAIPNIIGQVAGDIIDGAIFDAQVHEIAVEMGFSPHKGDRQVSDQYIRNLKLAGMSRDDIRLVLGENGIRGGLAKLDYAMSGGISEEQAIQRINNATKQNESAPTTKPTTNVDNIRILDTIVVQGSYQKGVGGNTIIQNTVAGGTEFADGVVNFYGKHPILAEIAFSGASFLTGGPGKAVTTKAIKSIAGDVFVGQAGDQLSGLVQDSVTKYAAERDWQVEMSLRGESRAQIGPQGIGIGAGLVAGIAFEVLAGKLKTLVSRIDADTGAIRRAGTRSCFAAGTLILTKSGRKPIENIEFGDLVWSRSEHDEGESSWRKVTEFAPTGEKEIYAVTVETKGGISETYRTTELHPFWVEKRVNGNSGEFIGARWLVPGDELKLHDGSAAYVKSAIRTSEYEIVYNFSVEGWHTYHIGKLGVWVHNACIDDVGAEWKNPDGTFNYIDPISGNLVKNVSRDGLAGDHLLPQHFIKNMNGWDGLTREQQKAILSDGANLMPLPRGLNSSKQNKIEFGADGGWTHYKGEAISDSFKEFLRQRQTDYLDVLQRKYGLTR